MSTSNAGAAAPRTPRRIFLTAFGSLGDLHPSIALGLGLRTRGHDPLIGSTSNYRAKVEAAGLPFRSIAAFDDDGKPDAEVMRRAMDGRKGTSFIVKELLMPRLRATFEATLAASEGADLLVSHPLTMATRLVAQVGQIPWASTMLAPCGFFSPHDPPIFPPALVWRTIRRLGPRASAPMFRLLKHSLRDWCEALHRLRAELGLPPEVHPLFEGGHSPSLVLALFSPTLGPPQPDWPAHSVVTGFPFYDLDGEPGLEPDLALFLDEGPPPIVFTLGSAAVVNPGRFFEQAAEAAARLGRRAVLLVGKDLGHRPARLPEGVGAFDYAPFSAIFPRASAIVHQGGVGTTGQAMRAGRPMLVVPFAHDQPDNADRVRRLGIARVIPRARFNADRASKAIETLLSDPRYAERAARVGERVRDESGVEAACDAIEALIDARSPSR